jgi:alkylation response protein AidB-like acyl-CoA dehydrogenase
MNETQILLRDMVSRLMASRYSFDERRAILSSEAGWSSAMWEELAQSGLLSVMIPEQHGGLGGGAAELMIVLEAVGRSLLLEPYISTAIVGGALFSRLDDPAALGRIADGSMRIAVAHDEDALEFAADNVQSHAVADDGHFSITGRKIVVRDAPSATHFLLSAMTESGDRDMILCLVPATSAGLSLRSYRTIDGVGAADIDLDKVRVAPESVLARGRVAASLIQFVLATAALANCCEAIGVMRAVLEQTVAFARQRQQFGRALSSFQVLQHRMVDMLIDVEQAQSITLRAAEAGAADADAVSYAKIRVNQALRNVAHSAVQIHGGIGTTEELILSQFFRRATAIQRQYGTSGQHYRQIERRREENGLSRQAELRGMAA